MKRDYRAHFVAGALASLAGLLTFLALHAMWILPIWFIFPMGLLIAGSGGLAVGWSYAELHHRLPKRPWTAFAVILLIAATLAPAVVLAELRQPMYNVSAAGVANLALGLPEAVFRFIGELLLTASLTGGLLGWWVGRSLRAVVATALAGFVFALGPGHNIPFIGGTPGVAKELVIMTAIIVVSAFVLVGGHTWLQALLHRKQGISHVD